jgi:hypothetical protein
VFIEKIKPIEEMIWPIEKMCVKNTIPSKNCITNNDGFSRTRKVTFLKRL